MARYTGAVCKLCRREGKKLFLKGERCYTGKCALDRRNYAPGQHGQGRKKASEYGTQLRAKQTARRYYGINEVQFSKYFEMAEKQYKIFRLMNGLHISKKTFEVVLHSKLYNKLRNNHDFK